MLQLVEQVLGVRPPAIQIDDRPGIGLLDRQTRDIRLELVLGLSSQKDPATSLLTSSRHHPPTTTRRARLQSGSIKLISATCNTPNRGSPWPASSGTAAIAQGNFEQAVTTERILLRREHEATVFFVTNHPANPALRPNVDERFRMIGRFLHDAHGDLFSGVRIG
jgi:hypothetical protein